MTNYAVTPACIPDARLVRILEVHLPDIGYLKLSEVEKLAARFDKSGQVAPADSTGSFWTDSEVLRALLDLEERCLAQRTAGKGWKRVHNTASVLTPGLFGPQLQTN